MAGLGRGAELAFPLGGTEVVFTGQPWLVNISPPPEDVDAGLLAPVRFTTRDVESAVDLGSVHVSLGYAHVFAHGDRYYDQLPRSFRAGMTADPVVDEPLIALVDEGVRLTKTSGYNQRSVYYTPVDVSSKLAPSALLAVRLQPEIINRLPTSRGPLNEPLFPGLLPYPFGDISVYQVGAVIGLEIGPRNTGVYVNFVNVGTVLGPIPAIRFSGPRGVDGHYHPDHEVQYDWWGLHRYYLQWSEATGTVELFADRGGETVKLFEVPITDFGEYYSGGPVRRGGVGDVTAVYGIDGPEGNQVLLAAMALAVDVGSPVIGGLRPGNYITRQQAYGIFSTPGNADPRLQSPGAWFDPPEAVLAQPDPQGTKQITRNGTLRLTKVTTNTTVGIYRDEPGFRRVATYNTPGGTVAGHDGLALEAKVFGIEGALAGNSSGMGFRIFDGVSVYELAMLDDASHRTLGLLRRNGDPTKLAHYYLPSSAINWAAPAYFRFTVDALRDKLELFGEDRVTPILAYPLGDRSFLPRGQDFRVDRLLPFLAFGHTQINKALGSFELSWLDYCHSYQAWEARTEINPATATPPFTSAGSGSVAPATSGLVIDCAAGEYRNYSRAANFDTTRGIAVEAALSIQSWQPYKRTGLYLVIDDGVYAYMMTFVDTGINKYVAFSQRAGLDQFDEQVGPEGLAAQLSTPLDWTTEHLYRFVRNPSENLQLFVDGERTPRISIPDSLHVGYPMSRYLTPTIGFGQYSLEGCRSTWRCVRAFCTSGYEFATIKNAPKAQLIDDLFGAEAIVVAHMLDRD